MCSVRPCYHLHVLLLHVAVCTRFLKTLSVLVSHLLIISVVRLLLL